MIRCTRTDFTHLTLRSLRACLTAFSLSPPTASQARLASALDRGTALLFCPSWPLFPSEQFNGALGSCWQDTAITQISSSTWGSSAFSQSWRYITVSRHTHAGVNLLRAHSFFSPSWDEDRDNEDACTLLRIILRLQQQQNIRLTRMSWMSLSPSSLISLCLLKSGSSVGMTLGWAGSGVMSLTGESGRGLEGDRAGSDLERQHISHKADGVWLTYVQHGQTHWIT